MGYSPWGHKRVGHNLVTKIAITNLIIHWYLLDCLYQRKHSKGESNILLFYLTSRGKKELVMLWALKFIFQAAYQEETYYESSTLLDDVIYVSFLRYHITYMFFQSLKLLILFYKRKMSTYINKNTFTGQTLLESCLSLSRKRWSRMTLWTKAFLQNMCYGLFYWTKTDVTKY